MRTDGADDAPGAKESGMTARSGGVGQRALPSLSFILLLLAVIAAGSGAVAWALTRPEPRAVTIIIPTPGPITVHVTGNVNIPGVYTLAPGSRVSDAVAAAGGLTTESTVNLAAEVRDGQQLLITTNLSPPDTTDGKPESDAEGSVISSGQVLLDLNTASALQLESLPNIGPARAAAIVGFRERNGPILFADDLTAIDGIGPATVEEIRQYVIQP